jgi:hypothetical protein
MSLTSNDPALTNANVNLTGAGTAPAIAVTPSALGFGAGVVLEPSTSNVTVRNSGTATLVLSSATAPAGFTVAGTYPTTLAPGATRTLAVTCTRATVGTFGGNLVLAHDAGAAVNVALSCQSVAARLIVEEPGLGNLWMYPGSSAPVRVRNAGPGPLTITDIGFAAGAWLTATHPALPLVLAPGETLSWTVTCSPSLVGYTNDKHLVQHDGLDGGSIGAHCSSIVDEIPEPPGFPGDPPVEEQ